MSIKCSAIMSLFLMAGCSAKVSSGACNTSIASGPVAGLQNSGLPGGYIRFADKACTAAFEYFKEGSTYKAKVYSARHCSPEIADNSLAEVKVGVDLYFDDGYYPTIPVEERFVSLRNKALAEVAALQLRNPELAKPLVIAMSTLPERAKNWCTQTPTANTATSQGSTAADRRLCWTFFDVGVFDITFPESTFANGANADVKAQLDKAITTGANKLDLAATKLNKSVPISITESGFNPIILTNGVFNWKDQLISMQNDLTLFTGASRLESFSTFVDWARKCPLPSTYEREPTDYAESCEIRENLIAIARKYFSEAASLDAQGIPVQKNVLDLAQQRGWGVDTPMDRTHGINDFRLEAAKDSVAIITRLYSRMTSLVDKLVAAPDALTVHTNLDSKVNAAGSNGGIAVLIFAKFTKAFQVFPLKSIRKSNSIPVLEKNKSYAFYLNVSFPLADEAIRFVPGDSGSLLMVGDAVPFAALNGVDDDFTSGGASISALPVPRSRRSETLPATEASAPSNTRTNTSAKEDKGPCQ